MPYFETRYWLDECSRWERRKSRDQRRFLTLLAILVALLVAMIFTIANAKASDVAVGDSIALGTGQALRVQTHAISSVGSCAIAGFAPAGNFDHVVISAGINDAPGSCIEAIRAKYVNAKVVWILPAAINSARAHVMSVAAANGDKTVGYNCPGGCTKSNFHPGNYFSVAAAVRHAWGEPFGNSTPSTPVNKAVVVAIPPTPTVAPAISGRSIFIPPVPVAVAPVDKLPHTQSPIGETFIQRVRDWFRPKAKVSSLNLPTKVSQILAEEAPKAGVPVELAARVTRVESRGQCSADDGNAQGVMQVQPRTAAAMGVHGNLHDCRTGIVAGVRYLHLALQKARGNWAIAAAYYNGGLGAAPVATSYSRKVMAGQ